MQSHIWDVSTDGRAQRLEHVEFTVQYGDGEEHIPRRLEREKRCGKVQRIDDHASRFSADGSCHITGGTVTLQGSPALSHLPDISGYQSLKLTASTNFDGSAPTKHTNQPR